MNRDRFSVISTALLVLCALGLTGAVVKREFFPASASGPRTEPWRVGNWEELAGAGQVIGRPGAPVRIVEFSDFQCPFCAQYAATLRAVRDRHPDRVALVYRHFPLDAIHPHARDAAVAAECAGEQGRFEPYHDRLFAQQDSIGSKAWDRFAAEADVPDSAAFRRCLADPRVHARVARDAALATRTRVEVTPTLVIAGTVIPGVISEAELERWIASASR